MNKLSWLIYWADAGPHLADFVCWFSFLMFAITSFMLLLGLTGFFGDESKYNARENEDLLYAHELSPRFRKLWPITFVFFFLWGSSFFVPSKDTFYMIAASEAGEQAVQTPEFSKVRQVLNRWLNNEITPGSDTNTTSK